MLFFRQYFRYGFAMFVLIALTALQASGVVSFFGIVPNLALSALVALFFYFKSFGEILLFSGAAASVLNWTRGIPWELAAFLAAVAAAFLLKKLTPWHVVLELAFLAGAASLLFALFADVSYPFSFPWRFGVELLYAELAAFLSLGLLMLFYGAPQERDLSRI